jgi:choice-of-anchor A domain-containing protein
MHRQGKLSFGITLLALLTPTVGLAKEPHSWCVPGKPMVTPPDGTTDIDTAAVVVHVCKMTGLSGCCNQSGGRWSLACVQAGADWARQNNLGGGDICGRYAWAQGPVTGTQQYYPRDFNLVTLTGGTTSFQDVQGPIAANGDVAASGFNLNPQSQGKGTALIATGTVGLNSGTINGNVQFGRKPYTDPGVTYVNGTRPDPNAPFQTSPIDFGAALGNLTDMSTKLALYDSIKVTSKSNGNTTITFTGSDTELSVFSIDSSLFSNTTQYNFAVPSTSAVIVNVTGKNPMIRNAGFAYSTSRNQILWNFLQAETLTIASVVFPGSILAPKAAAQLQFGQINGTVVVGSSVTLSELHWSPYQVPSVGGCLGPRETGWSCSADTHVDDTGNVAITAPEAGFLQIDGGPYTSEGQGRTSPTHRIWYSFQPASFMPEDKPLAVLFNGGPGVATSCFMFGFNTGPYTLDPDVAKSVPITTNLSPWTRQFNLLYIDAPGTGFSYPMSLADGTKPSVGIDLDHDAGTVIRAVIRFVDHHPLVQKNPVILVGESYGGPRAVLMIEHLLGYQNLTNTNSAYQDQNLYDDLKQHFTAVFPGQDPTTLSPAQVATQFGHQVLIEPVVLGSIQYTYGYYNKNATGAGCVSGYDSNECDWTDGTYLAHVQTIADRLMNIGTLQQAIGVDPTTIKWMYASERNPSSGPQAYGRGPHSDINGPSTYPTSTSAFTTRFGNLGSDDSYFLIMNSQVSDYQSTSQHGYPGSRWWTDNWIGRSFLNDVIYVKTFITNARYDMNVWAPAIPHALTDPQGSSYWGDLVSSTDAVWDQTPRTGFDRTGWIKLTYHTTGLQTEIRFPYYDGAGHSVVIHQSPQLRDDVATWYASPTASQSLLQDTMSSPQAWPSSTVHEPSPFSDTPRPYLWQ